MKLTNIIKEEYSEINEATQSRVHTIPNERVKLLLDIYESWLSESENIDRYKKIEFRVNPPPYERRIMDFTELKTRSVLYTKEDITAFSFAIQELNSTKNIRAGYFLSSLINTHLSRKENSDKEQILQNRINSPVPSDSLPYFISTEGIEHFVGLGAYNKADIIVSGKGGDYLGIRMLCGSITIHGTCGRGVGQDMRGGTIYLNDVFEGYDWMRLGGEIFHKGKRLRWLWEIQEKNEKRK